MTTTITYSTRDLINELVDGKTLMCFNPGRVVYVTRDAMVSYHVKEDGEIIGMFRQIVHALKFAECLVVGDCEWKVL